MRHLIRITLSLSFLLTPGGRALAEGDPALRLGAALHAFDHLGAQGQQLDAAVASGVTVIYATGVGSDGYEGIPATDVWKRHRDDAAAYCASAKARGVQRMIGYLCATSIVKLETFDAHWPDELRARLSKPPSEWRQQGRDGNPLPSWYGGDYQPACMNNPDWRTYEKYMVRMQLEAGHDGIFFDNPTVHPKGCYCPQCMDGFKDFMEGQGATLVDPTLQDLYKLADEHRQDFLRYRCTIARDFLAEMRAYARTIKPDALVTANNSLNSPQAFYSQCQDYAYNIAELSKAEDFIVLEDMGTQPRMTAKGDILEYGPTLRMVRAIANAKPIVNVTIAEADYHTPPNLMRLAMAESAANGASYMAWTTWPDEHRARLSTAARAEVELLRAHQVLLNEATVRRDVVLFLPFRGWLETRDCAALKLADALAKSNLQFDVLCEENFAAERLAGAPVLLAESADVLSASERAVIARYTAAGGTTLFADSADWLDRVKQRLPAPAIRVTGPAAVRAYVADTPQATVIHLLNLNIERLSSFEDKVTPATQIGIDIAVNGAGVKKAEVFSSDANSTKGEIPFAPSREGAGVSFTLPNLEVASIVVMSH